MQCCYVFQSYPCVTLILNSPFVDFDTFFTTALRDTGPVIDRLTQHSKGCGGRTNPTGVPFLPTTIPKCVSARAPARAFDHSLEKEVDPFTPSHTHTHTHAHTDTSTVSIAQSRSHFTAGRYVVVVFGGAREFGQEIAPRS